MQIANVYLCRSKTESVFRLGFFSNRLILWGILWEIALILAIDYSRWGNRMFGTAPIRGEAWLFVIPVALGMFLLEELRKWATRRASRPKTGSPPSRS